MPNSPSDVASGAPNPLAYVDNDDGTVTDSVTGLMWQRSSAPETHDWVGARAYCSTLALAGYDDWRLPSRIELVSIIDDSPTETSGDSAAFPNTPGGYFWTSSRLAGSRQDAWTVVFNGGAYVVLTADSSYVRCVRSAPGEGAHYTVAEGTVTDNQTKLTWQREVPDALYAWEDAKSYCGSLGGSLGGTGWRLPTVKELQTLVDDSRLNPAIDTSAFPSTPAGAFWSSSSLVGSTDYAWNVYFYNGGTYSFFTESTFAVRCVRS